MTKPKPCLYCANVKTLLPQYNHLLFICQCIHGNFLWKFIQALSPPHRIAGLTPAKHGFWESPHPSDTFQNLWIQTDIRRTDQPP